MAMRSKVHPITGILYEEQGDGLVRISKGDERGIFHFDGRYVEGALTHADPHFLLYIGGPNLPEGKDILWQQMTPAGLEDEAEAATRAYSGGMVTRTNSVYKPAEVAMYVGDPGMDTPAGPRSAGWLEIEDFLGVDSHPERIPEHYWKLNSPMEPGIVKIPTDRFTSVEIHKQEIERIWKRVWQVACREDDLPNVGDYHVYEIANLSFLIVRVEADVIKAYFNACLHRGRLLREWDGKGAKELRCPFHGWSWRLDGSLKEVTCAWDWPGLSFEENALPEAKVGRWGGFVFINPDPDCEPLMDYLGTMPEHYDRFEFDKRYTSVHVAKPMPANWKVTQEAFMEAYHVIATHPQLLTGSDNANSRYDVYGNWSRAGGPSGGGSPMRGIVRDKEEVLTEFREMADANRSYLRGFIGDKVDRYSDIEMTESSFNDLFPNTFAWGGWARIVFQFRPYGDDPDRSVMHVWYLAPWPESKPRPAAAPTHWLPEHGSWCDAPELGGLARIIDQDVYNLGKMTMGFKAKRDAFVQYSSYQESKIRNFYRNWERWMGVTPS